MLLQAAPDCQCETREAELDQPTWLTLKVNCGGHEVTTRFINNKTAQN